VPPPSLPPSLPPAEELWTLLNFCQPDIFDDLGVFRSWFGFQSIGKDTTVDDIIDEEHRERVVTKLHEVLRPFLLRRMKADVNIDLPAKKELVVYAHMSEIQHDYYRLAQAGQLREALVQQGVPDADKVSEKPGDAFNNALPPSLPPSHPTRA
jgi:ATP-dependent DNA helicase